MRLIAAIKTKLKWLAFPDSVADTNSKCPPQCVSDFDFANYLLDRVFVVSKPKAVIDSL